MEHVIKTLHRMDSISQISLLLYIIGLACAVAFFAYEGRNGIIALHRKFQAKQQSKIFKDRYNGR